MLWSLHSTLDTRNRRVVSWKQRLESLNVPCLPFAPHVESEPRALVTAAFLSTAAPEDAKEKTVMSTRGSSGSGPPPASATASERTQPASKPGYPFPPDIRAARPVSSFSPPVTPGLRPPRSQAVATSLSQASPTQLTSQRPSRTPSIHSMNSDGKANLDPSAAKLVVVSNRLPITITKHAPDADLSHLGDTPASVGEDAKYTFKMSSGGLVSALSGCKRQMSFSWIGWSGVDVSEKDRDIVQKKLADEYSCKAVWLEDDLADRHYNGFSNSILWPLFHYHPAEMIFDESHWEAYKQANMLFAEALHEEVRQILDSGEDALVWVQDYHLMLLPKLLRQLLEASNLARPDKKRGRFHIGFFLHTPFPSSEIYRILPVRREILLGILHCDLIGFHTYDYARHFLSSCTRILGLPTMPNGLEFEGRYVHVGSYPIGIDPTQFTENLKQESVQKRIAQLKQRFDGIKVIVGVDRLDYIKGVPLKLHALDVFLTEHPEWIGKVVLLQVAVPSRQDVEEYKNLRTSLNELVGRINGQFGTIEHMPIHFLHKSVTFDELCALYAVSDVCLVTSTRDGMNLVSYEYVASQQAGHGVMILSEFAGAAHSLNGSLIVNPWATDQVADAINRAVTMSPQEREENFEKLFSYVSKYTATHWGLSFVQDMLKIRQHELGIDAVDA